MRCPKCGYNSFDHLENCKKCGKDLMEHKSRFGIKNILLSGVAIGAEETVEEVETEEVIETTVAPEPEETTPEAAIENPVTESESDDFGFDFMGDSDDEENPAFDELFEESSLEDDLDETLPAPEKAAEEDPEETFLDDGLDDPSAFDLGEPEDLEPNFSLDEPEDPEKGVSTDTDLGLGETDFVNFDEDDTLGAEENPNRPFDCEEVLQTEEPPTTDFTDISEEPVEELQAAPLTDPQPEQGPLADDPFSADEDFDLEEMLQSEEPLPTTSIAMPEEPAEQFSAASLTDPQPEQDPIADDPFSADEDFDLEERRQSEEPLPTTPIAMPEEPAPQFSATPLADPQPDQAPGADNLLSADEDFQKELFAGDEELLPLPDTTLEERPLKSLEASFGESSFDIPPVSGSDDFALGALPAAHLVNAQNDETPELAETPEPINNTEPPLEEQDVAEETVAIQPPFGRRVSAFFCDIILLGLVGFCFIIVAETALSKKTVSIFPSLETLIDLSIPYFLVVFCLTFGYFTLFHFLAGQTPGKMATSIRVETIFGESLSFSQAFMRSVGGLIQVLPAGLGYLSVLLNKDGHGWNDRLAGTRLIDLKNLPEELEMPEELIEQEDS